MVALSESGVPIVALPGAGYELVEGYDLPPLRFTPAEAAALFLGVQILLAHTEGRTGADTERAAEVFLSLSCAQTLLALIDEPRMTMLHLEPMRSYS
jgi:predicted DNA-binding transcriptional regulator YafY